MLHCITFCVAVSFIVKSESFIAQFKGQFCRQSEDTIVQSDFHLEKHSSVEIWHFYVVLKLAMSKTQKKYLFSVLFVFPFDFVMLG